MAALAVAGHLSTAELGRRYRAARDRVERGHLQVVWLASQGRSGREVARVMGLSEPWVAEIVRRYDEKGPDGLAARERRRQAALGGRGRGGAAGGAGRTTPRWRFVDGAEGGGVDGGPARARGLAATRLGLPQEARLPPASATAPAR
jgi:Winged helix-turn helix